LATCPNCGTNNADGARFCQECGADLRSFGSEPTNPTSTPPYGDYQESTPTPFGTPGWQVPIEPVPQKNGRGWLWAVVGILAGCLICCCVAGVWASTSGESTVNGWFTRVADELTEIAPSPTPHR
jgi:hypothetical protein